MYILLYRPKRDSFLISYSNFYPKGTNYGQKGRDPFDQTHQSDRHQVGIKPSPMNRRGMKKI